MEIWEKIKKLRESKGFTPRGLARAANVSNEYIYKLESGAYKSLGVDKLVALSAALGVDPSDILHESFKDRLQKSQRELDETVEERIEDEGYIKPDDDMRELLEAWDNMDETHREILKSTARQFSQVGLGHQKKRPRKHG